MDLLAGKQNALQANKGDGWSQETIRFSAWTLLLSAIALTRVMFNFVVAFPKAFISLCFALLRANIDFWSLLICRFIPSAPSATMPPVNQPRFPSPIQYTLDAIAPSYSAVMNIVTLGWYRSRFRQLVASQCRAYCPAAERIVIAGCKSGESVLGVLDAYGPSAPIHILALECSAHMLREGMARVAKQAGPQVHVTDRFDEPTPATKTQRVTFAECSADLVNLPLPDHSADLYISSFSLAHVSDRVAAFAEMARVLQKGGVGKVMLLDLRPDLKQGDFPSSIPRRLARLLLPILGVLMGASECFRSLALLMELGLSPQVELLEYFKGPQHSPFQLAEPVTSSSSSSSAPSTPSYGPISPTTCASISSSSSVVSAALARLSVMTQAAASVNSSSSSSSSVELQPLRFHDGMIGVYWGRMAK